MAGKVKCTVCDSEFTNHARMRVHRALKHENDEVPGPDGQRKAQERPAEPSRTRSPAARKRKPEPEPEPEPEPDDDDDEDDDEDEADDDGELPWE